MGLFLVSKICKGCWLFFILDIMGFFVELEFNGDGSNLFLRVEFLFDCCDDLVGIELEGCFKVDFLLILGIVIVMFFIDFFLVGFWVLLLMLIKVKGLLVWDFLIEDFLVEDVIVGNSLCFFLLFLGWI